MKKAILFIMAVLMLIASVLSAKGIEVQPEDDFQEISTSRVNPFFGGVQQTVLPSSQLVHFGEVVEFTFITTSLGTTDRAIYVFELYKGGVLYQRKGGAGSLIVQSRDEFFVSEGQSFQTKIAQYFSEDFYEEGSYGMVAYLYDRASGRIISQQNDVGVFQITTGLTDNECKNQFEGTCNLDIGISYNCRVSPTGTSCQCDVESCALREVCSDGECIASEQCDPNIYEFSTICDEITTDECGGSVSRNTDGQSCGANSRCINGECIAECEPRFVGERYCDGDNVMQTLKNSDCTTEDKVVEVCSADSECNAGQCVTPPDEGEEELPAQEEPEPDGGATPLPEPDLCVVDNQCGFGHVCESGSCVREDEIEPSNAWIWAIIIIIVIIIISLVGWNMIQPRLKKRKRK